MNLRIAELDFDSIKTNLKTFLQSQQEFTDYDFEGSSLSVLIDLLAYNTHYNAYLANMLMNEMFLDSAVKRSSAVSIAKHLGYTPRSARSATASINVTVNNPTGLPSTLTLERYTPFISTINGTIFTFLTNESKTTSRVATSYQFDDIEVKEGSLQSYSFVVAKPSPDSKYELPSSSIDTTTLLVTVQNSTSDTSTTVYNLATEITGLNGDSAVYFLEQNTKGKYEIYFGDGIIGRSLVTGNIISVRYIVSSGTSANISNKVSQTFQASGTVAGSTSIAVSVNYNSTGAADEETITEIRYNAPKVNAARNRVITTADYESVLSSQITEAESIAVWGGEDNQPPLYGKVLVSLKPYDGYVISQGVKEYIRNYIFKEKRIVTTQIQFVDPIYFFVSLGIGVEYSPTKTPLTAEQLTTNVKNTVETYFQTNLQKFNKNYIESSLMTDILNTSQSITSVNIVSKLSRVIVPNLNDANVYASDTALLFRNAIQPGTLTSTYFYISKNGVDILGKIIDVPDDAIPNLSGTGTLRVVNFLSNETVINSIGTVNYSRGIVEINSITPTGYPSGLVDIRILVGVQNSAQRLNLNRGEIFVLDTSIFNVGKGTIDGVKITTTAVV